MDNLGTMSDLELMQAFLRANTDMHSRGSPRADGTSARNNRWRCTQRHGAYESGGNGFCDAY